MVHAFSGGEAGGSGGGQRSKEAIRSSCVAIVPSDGSCMIALAAWMTASACEEAVGR